MLKRTYRLYNTVRLASVMRKRRTLVQAQNIATSQRIRQESVLAELESFVQDVAMTSLQMDGGQNQTLDRLYATHQRYMEGLFNSLLVSGQWTEETAGSYRSLLLSPIVDHPDAQLIVSALTMALLVVFEVAYACGCLRAKRRRCVAPACHCVFGANDARRGSGQSVS